MATKGSGNSKNNVELGVTLSQDTINELSRGLSSIQRMFSMAFGHMQNVFGNFQKVINTTANASGGGTKSAEDEMKAVQDNLITHTEKLDKLQQRLSGYYEKLSNTSDQEKINKAIKRTEVAILKEKAAIAQTELKLESFGNTSKDTAQKVEDAGEKIEDQNKDTKQSNKEVADSFTLVNYTALGLFRKLLRWGTRTFSALTTAGSDYMEINSRFNRILGEGADIAEESARRIANAYGRDLTEVKNYVTSIYTILRNSNLEMNTAIALSSNLTAIANELASVWDTDVDQAINAVISGLQGLPKAMKRYGVYLTQSEIKEYLVEAGFLAEDYAGKLGSGERALATYLKVMKDSGYAIHDFANTQASVANQLRILGSSFTGLQRSLGSMMNTVLSPVLQVFNYILKIVASLANELNNLPEPLKFIIGLFTTFITITPIVVGGFILLSYFGRIWKKQLAEIATKTAEATGATKVFGKSVLWLANNWKKVMLWGSVFLLFVTSLVGIIGDLTKDIDDNSNSLEDSKNAAKDYMRTLAGFDDVNVLSFSDKQEDSQKLNFENADSIEALNKTFEELVGNTSGISNISESLDSLKYIILAVTGAIIAFKVAMNWDKLNGLLIKFKTHWDNLKGKIAGTTETTKKYINTMDTAKKSQVSLAQSMGATVIAVASIAYAWTQLTSIWSSESPTWQKIIRTVLTLTAAVAGLAAAFFLLRGNYIGAGIAGGVAAAAIAGNAITGSIWNNEQQLATGGVAVGATRAVIGEGIYDEAVIPLGQSPQFNNMKSDIASAVVEGLNGANLSGGQPINITINVDEDYIYKAYNRQAKLYGRRI
jgi:hypothetical protein